MSDVRGVREALIQQLLADVDSLTTRLEAVGTSIEAAASELTAAGQAYRRSAIEAASVAKASVGEFIVARTNDALANAGASIRATADEAVRAALKEAFLAGLEKDAEQSRPARMRAKAQVLSLVVVAIGSAAVAACVTAVLVR